MDLSVDELRELLCYNAATGELIWRKNSRAAKAGDRAGYIHYTKYSPFVDVKVRGHHFKAARLIWAIITGEWPRGVVIHIDRDSLNTRWENLKRVDHWRNPSDRFVERTCPACGNLFPSRKQDIARGYGKYCSPGCSRKNKFPDANARFLAKVKKSDNCWEWLSAHNRGGYGTFLLNKKRISAHRFSYELHVGHIPNGLFVLHKCDNPRCVRPDHLFLGTAADNTQDMIRKGRGRCFGRPFSPSSKEERPTC